VVALMILAASAALAGVACERFAAGEWFTGGFCTTVAVWGFLLARDMFKDD